MSKSDSRVLKHIKTFDQPTDHLVGGGVKEGTEEGYMVDPKTGLVFKHAEKFHDALQEKQQRDHFSGMMMSKDDIRYGRTSEWQIGGDQHISRHHDVDHVRLGLGDDHDYNAMKNVQHEGDKDMSLDPFANMGHRGRGNTDVFLGNQQDHVKALFANDESKFVRCPLNRRGMLPLKGEIKKIQSPADHFYDSDNRQKVVKLLGSSCADYNYSVREYCGSDLSNPQQQGITLNIDSIISFTFTDLLFSHARPPSTLLEQLNTADVA